MVYGKPAGYHGLGNTIQHRVDALYQFVIPVFDINAISNFEDQSRERTTRPLFRYKDSWKSPCLLTS